MANKLELTWYGKDEPIIVEGLTKLIPWGDYGCEIAGTANHDEKQNAPEPVTEMDRFFPVVLLVTLTFQEEYAFRRCGVFHSSESVLKPFHLFVLGRIGRLFIHDS